MAQFKAIFDQDLTKPVLMRYCEGLVFTGNNDSNMVGVRLYDDGTAYSGGGTVAGTVVNSRGQTVAITGGTISGNLVSVTLKSAMLAVPGRIGVYVTLTSGTTVTTVLAAMFTAQLTDTGTAIDPGTIIPSVSALVTQIEDAVDSIPASLTNLMAAVAPIFNDSTAYTAGSYVWLGDTTNGGVLYRFTTDHAAGSWTGTDAVVANLGGDLADLKSAVDQIGRNGIKYTGYTFVSGNIGGTGGINSNNDYIRSYGGTQPQAQAGDYFVILPPYQGIVHAYSVNDQVTNKWLRKINSTAKTGIIPIPDSLVGNYISVAVQKTGHLSDDISADIATIDNYVYLIRGNGIVNKLDDLTDTIATDETKITNNRGDIELSFRDTYSPGLTLASGTIAPSGAAGDNANFIRTNTASFQIIEDGDYIYVGGDYEIVRAIVYNSRSMSSTAFHALLRPSTTNKHSLSIPSAYAGKYIGFVIQKTSMIGQDISAYVDDATANTHYYSPGNGKKEISILSNKVGALENELPDYYFANNYLPGRITEINNNRVGLSPNSLEFVWFTDLHIYDVDGNARNGLQSVNLCRYVAKNANVTSVYCGGDLVDNRLNDGMTKVGCLEALGKVRAYLDPIWDNTYMIIGNHEWNDPNGQVETNRLTIGAIIPATTYDSYKHKNAKTIFNGKASLYGSYAVDDDNYKVRTIFLGCSNSNSLYKAEYEWLAEVLRTTPSGYNVLMMSHIGFAEAPQTSAALLARFALVVDMLEAAESKNEEYRFTLGTTTVGPFDFSGCNLSVIACITGHAHYDLSMVTIGGTLVIGTTADTGPGPGSSEKYRNARVLGTITEQAVDVVQIDLDNRKIYMTRIGGSFDGTEPLENPNREFDY